MGHIRKIALFYFLCKLFVADNYPAPQILPYALLLLGIFLDIFSIDNGGIFHIGKLQLNWVWIQPFLVASAIGISPITAPLVAC